MIIDFRVNPPTPKGMARFTNPPPRMKRYTELYPPGSFHQKQEQVCMPVERFLQFLDAEGVDKVVLFAGDIGTTYGSRYPNEELAEYVNQAPDRLIGFAGADPHKGVQAVRDFERAVKELGLKGLNMGPWEHRLRADDRKYYPLYEKCVELDVPVILHTSVNLSRELYMDFGRPLYLDRVAVDFPDLKIVASHGGWPWVPEMVAVAYRHPTVYIELSGMRPKYIGTPHSGWETLLQFGNSVLQDQVLFGTDYPLLPMRRTVEEIRQLPLKEEVKGKWLGGNAARLLKISS
ncbi:MAG: amidohydrolase family protein [Nitrospinota bacterium]